MLLAELITGTPCTACPILFGDDIALGGGIAVPDDVIAGGLVECRLEDDVTELF